MEYLFRKATIAELDAIMVIVKNAVHQMLSEGKRQ